MIIPIAIILALLAGATIGWGAEGTRYAAAGGIIVLPIMFMLLFRQKYPRWWFDWNLALTKFSTRVSAYILLLRDEYPSTDEEQSVHVDLIYPSAKDEMNRWLPLVKWIMAIPHYIIIYLLAIGAWVCVIIAWFAILFTSRYPKSLFEFVVGVMRWGLRVEAYAFLLITDRYPPFSLD
jgi:cytochrome c biogenesis protein CcdA